MAVTYQQLQSWKPDGLSDAATKLNQKRKKLIDQQDEMDAGKPPSTWDSQSASAARSRHRRLVEDLNDIAAPLSAVVAGLDSAASSIRSAQKSAKGAYEGAEGRGWRVTISGTNVEIKDPTPPESTSPNPNAEPRSPQSDLDDMESYANTISDALVAAAEAEADLEAVLNSATTGGYDGGSGDISSAIPPEIVDILASGHEGRDKPDKAAMTRFASTMTELEDNPELKRDIMSEFGRKGIADAFEDAKEYGIDLHDPMGATGRAVIEDWVESDVKGEDVNRDTTTLLDAYKKDSTFTKELFANVSPKEWAEAIQQENSDAFRGPQDISKEDRETYSRFLKASGTALATYSQGHADPTGLADDWFKAIRAGEGENASALTLMIKKGGEDGAAFQDDFMYNLADDVYKWDKEHGGHAAWDGPGSGLIDPDAHVEYGAANPGFKLISGSAADGMANILGGMANTPDAAQRFFMDGYPDGDTTKENSRLDYFLNERGFDASVSDEGDGFGEALEAATVGARDVHGPEKSGALATDLFKMIADNSGKTVDGIGKYGTDWHIPGEMNDSLGGIAAGYSSDVYDILQPKGGVGEYLDISENELKAVIGEIGYGPDKTGVETLASAVVVEGNDRASAPLMEYMKDHPNATLADATAAHIKTEYATLNLGDMISGQNTRTGNVLADVIGYSDLGNEDDRMSAAERASLAQKAFSIGSEFVPGAEAIAGKDLSDSAKNSIDITKSEGIDALMKKVGDTPPASDWISGQDDAGNRLLDRSLMDTYARAGLIEVPEEFATTDAEGKTIIRPDIHNAADIKNAFPDKSDAEIQALEQKWSKWDNDISPGAESAGADGKQQYDNDLNEALADVKEQAGKSHEERQKWIDGK